MLQDPLVVALDHGRKGGDYDTNTKKYINTVPCQPEPAYRTDLPTDADAMLSHLYTISAKLVQQQAGKSTAPGTSIPDKQDLAWDNAVELIVRAYLPAETRAALFEALAKIPGSVATRGVVDALGRPGIALRRGDSAGSGSESEVIVDPKTYVVLGSRTQLEPGRVNSLSVIRTEIVDKAGQLP